MPAAGDGPGLRLSQTRATAALIADVVRLDKGHTEGLEPRITETLIKMIVAAPGGKAQELSAK